MAVLNVTFCANNLNTETGWPIPNPDYSTSEDITIAVGSAATTGTAPAGSRLVRLYAEAACRYVIAAAPTALSTSTPIAAGETQLVRCAPSDKVACIQF